jgi:hypothetical protein
MHAHAAAALFPQPLHLTRVVETPFAERATVEEYLAGNRIITVSADSTVIVDYDKQTITEIKRAGTYSITPFDAMARATQSARKGVSAAAAAKTTAADWEVRDSGRPAGRDRGDYTIARPAKASAIVEVQIGVDPTVRLSREAVEALLGSAYPQKETIEAGVAMRAIERRGGADRRVQTLGANAVATAETLALPIEQSVTYAMGDENVVVSSRVTRVGNELPPPAALEIPAGAKLVASPAVETQRRLEELDRFSPPNQ